MNIVPSQCSSPPTEDLQIDVIDQFAGDVRTDTGEPSVVSELCLLDDQRSILFDELVAILTFASQESLR